MIQTKLTAQRDLQATEAAAELIPLAMACQSTLALEANGHCVNAKSLLGVMCLQIVPGASLTLTADGPDEEEALQKLAAFFQDTDSPKTRSRPC